jgi:hypothetical protein
MRIVQGYASLKARREGSVYFGMFLQNADDNVSIDFSTCAEDRSGNIYHFFLDLNSCTESHILSTWQHKMSTINNFFAIQVFPLIATTKTRGGTPWEDGEQLYRSQLAWW